MVLSANCPPIFPKYSYGNIVSALSEEGLKASKRAVWMTIEEFREHGMVYSHVDELLPAYRKRTASIVKLIQNKYQIKCPEKIPSVTFRSVQAKYRGSMVQGTMAPIAYL